MVEISVDIMLYSSLFCRLIKSFGNCIKKAADDDVKFRLVLFALYNGYQSLVGI
jgi:hypothetical protein